MFRLRSEYRQHLRQKSLLHWGCPEPGFLYAQTHVSVYGTDNVRRRLALIIQRRNQIAHESDIDPIDVQRYIALKQQNGHAIALCSTNMMLYISISRNFSSCTCYGAIFSLIFSLTGMVSDG